MTTKNKSNYYNDDDSYLEHVNPILKSESYYSKNLNWIKDKKFSHPIIEKEKAFLTLWNFIGNIYYH